MQFAHGRVLDLVLAFDLLDDQLGIADQLQIPLFTLTWIARFAVILGPIVAYWVTKRICLGLQRKDAHLLEHGVETGIIRQLPNGAYIEETRPVDEDLRAFYERLLRAVADSGLRDGDWRLCECTGWPDNDSYRRLVAWCWGRELVVINLSEAPAQARVHVPWDDVAGRTWELSDRLSGARFERGGDELAADGLFVALDGWAAHFLAFGQESTPASEPG